MFSTRPSVLFFLSAQLLRNRLTEFRETLQLRRAYHVDVHIHRIFLGVTPFFELRNLAKIKDTTETVCQRNSSEAAQQNFLKFCSNEGRCKNAQLHIMSFVTKKFHAVLLSGFSGVVLTNCFSSIFHFGRISKFKKGHYSQKKN